MNIFRKEKGFTIIEVVLVLAIAGLIFLMVFIALPALQRSQRDTQRKNDLSRAITAVNSYASNNRGAIPSATIIAEWTRFMANYLTTNNDKFDDPAGTNSGTYTFSLTPMSNNPTYSSTVSTIYVSPGKVCDGEGITDAGARKVALRMKLEGGGIACQNN
jgi:prepilin-type N-terminal cleavage/methylation domain-containing protein